MSAKKYTHNRCSGLHVEALQRLTSVNIALVATCRTQIDVVTCVLITECLTVRAACL